MADFDETMHPETGVKRLVILYSDNSIDTVESTHTKYEQIKELVRDRNTSDDDIRYMIHSTEKDLVERLMTITERISVANGNVYVDGESVHDAIAEHIVRMLHSGDNNYLRVVHFYENLLQNPSTYAQEQLYAWLQANEMFALTPEGYVLGYKGVTTTSHSLHSGAAYVDGELVRGQIPYEVGSRVTMPRSRVDNDPNEGCSRGLHVGDWSFASGFGSKILEVSFNPRDVVSVPSHDTRKLRVCGLNVLNITKNPHASTSYDMMHEYEDEAFFENFKA